MPRWQSSLCRSQRLLVLGGAGRSWGCSLCPLLCAASSTSVTGQGCSFSGLYSCREAASATASVSLISGALGAPGAVLSALSCAQPAECQLPACLLSIILCGTGGRALLSEQPLWQMKSPCSQVRLAALQGQCMRHEERQGICMLMRALPARPRPTSAPRTGPGLQRCAQRVRRLCGLHPRAQMGCIQAVCALNAHNSTLLCASKQL